MHLTVDLARSPEGRLEGTLVTGAGDRYPFAGTLDLLRVLEGLEPVLRDRDEPGRDEPGRDELGRHGGGPR